MGLAGRIKMITDDIITAPESGLGEIALLCDKYGSDKGSFKEGNHPYCWRPHTYSQVYEVMFREKRYSIKNVFECGIGTNNTSIPSNMTANGKLGASLRMWRDYFVNAKVYGADIDQGCLFEEDRITTGWMDQLSSSAIDAYFKDKNVEFDVMVDDGLHTAEAALSLLKSALRYLKSGGVYIIEDLTEEQIFEVRDYLVTLSGYSVKYALMNNDNRHDNNLVIISRL